MDTRGSPILRKSHILDNASDLSHNGHCFHHEFCYDYSVLWPCVLYKYLYNSTGFLARPECLNENQSRKTAPLFRHFPLPQKSRYKSFEDKLNRVSSQKNLCAHEIMSHAAGLPDNTSLYKIKPF